MKNEADFCAVIKNSFIYSSKFPDPSGDFMSTSKRPFDGIALITGAQIGRNNDDKYMVCWEAKFMKKMQAFSMRQRLEEHQDYNLYMYGQALNIIPLVILGVDIDRTDKRAYLFDYRTCRELYTNNISIHKKYLEQLPYCQIKKGRFEINNILQLADVQKTMA